MKGASCWWIWWVSDSRRRFRIAASSPPPSRIASRTAGRSGRTTEHGGSRRSPAGPAPRSRGGRRRPAGWGWTRRSSILRRRRRRRTGGAAAMSVPSHSHSFFLSQNCGIFSVIPLSIWRWWLVVRWTWNDQFVLHLFFHLACLVGSWLCYVVYLSHITMWSKINSCDMITECHTRT